MELVIGALVIAALGYLFFYRDSKIWGTNKAAQDKPTSVTEDVKTPEPVIEVQAIKVEDKPIEAPAAIEEKPKKKTRKPKVEKVTESKPKTPRKPKMSVAK